MIYALSAFMALLTAYRGQPFWNYRNSLNSLKTRFLSIKYKLNRHVGKRDYNLHVNIDVRTRGSVVGTGTMLQAGRWRDRFPIKSLDFSIDLIQPHYGPGVNSATNGNDNQESSWG
jgi:hypothetical protein